VQTDKGQVLQLIENDREEMIGFLQQLVQTGSENPPGNERQVAVLIGDKLREIGCRVELQEVEPDRLNVIAAVDGQSRERLLFNGHMDTVKIGNPAEWNYPPLGGEIHDGFMYGRGATDMKAGLVSMIYAMKAAIASGIPLKKGLLFTAVVDEEVYFKGTQALLDKNCLQDCAVGFVSEPTGLQIHTCLKGGIEFTARTSGKSAHSGLAYDGINAIYNMNKVIAALMRYNDGLKDKISLPGLKYPTVNVGKIEGGTGVTFVPDCCEIEFDRQVFPGEDILAVEKEIFALVENLGREQQFAVSLKKNQHFNAWQVAETEPVVQLLATAYARALGAQPAFAGFTAYCEVEMLAANGIPAVIFGPGDLGTAHRPNERVKVTEVIDAAKVYAQVIWDFNR
jgi:succinyl-diaminopimelate desuccinylase